MTAWPEPSAANVYLAPHIASLQASLRHWSGRELADTTLPLAEQARRLFEAPFALLSHNTAVDPIFTYANRTAMALWEMDWQQFTSLPSRYSAEPMEQAARAQFLAEVSTHGFIDHYEGVRISKTGRRFQIRNALVWNLIDEMGQPCGQAALFSEWLFLP